MQRGEFPMEYSDFLRKLSKPAQRALEVEGIDSFEKLATYSKKELLAIHGVGPSSLPVIDEFLNSVGLKRRDA